MKASDNEFKKCVKYLNDHGINDINIYTQIYNSNILGYEKTDK